MIKNGLFTSESVSPGHPDKIADQISDAVLDAVLTEDPDARVACETLVKTGMVLVTGEMRTHSWVDIEDMVRATLKDIGYDRQDLGFDAQSCAVINAIGKQSPDIAQGVDVREGHQLGAGDQGLMFGYACQETDVFMPAPITYAHRLMRRQAECLHEGILPWLRPDAKCQLTFQYQDSQPVGIDNIVLSTQHDPDVSQADLYEGVMTQLIQPVIPQAWLSEATRFHINPTGRFVMGGPMGDCGLTGRKIIVDTYGGAARHGGGAFSGKDPTKVDRSGAYMARHLAKCVVAAGMAQRCEIQLTYAIGVCEPTSLNVETFGTGALPDAEIASQLRKHFDLTPAGMIKHLDLQRPIYQLTAVNGHFGHEDPAFTWEATDTTWATKA